MQTYSGPLRAYIRRWITEWDLRRLYPEAEIDIEIAAWRTEDPGPAADGGEETPSDQSLIDDVLGESSVLS